MVIELSNFARNLAYFVALEAVVITVFQHEAVCLLEFPKTRVNFERALEIGLPVFARGTEVA